MAYELFNLDTTGCLLIFLFLSKIKSNPIATNEKYYSFGSKDTDLDELCKAFNKIAEKQVTPQSHLQVVRFDKEKTLESA